MTWTTPSFDEIKMDAEIGSYQDDFDPAREQVPFLDVAVDRRAARIGAGSSAYALAALGRACEGSRSSPRA